MCDCLSKEQLLLLQHNLTYEVYEQFMGLFPKDELLPTESHLRINYIFDIMKEHDFWGEIKGWGDKRVYKNIPMHCSIPYQFTGTTKKELLEFLDNFRYNGNFQDAYLMPVIDKDNTSTMNICHNCYYVNAELKEENVIMPCINCSQANEWIFKGKICLGGIPYSDSEGFMLNDTEISPEDLASLVFQWKTPSHQERLEMLPNHVAKIYKTFLDN